jgi:UDP-N-acetylmuramyl pentapeptide phosphotransferase/UDP-N-acetylglucosamine-1-phosphate transferase
VKPNFAKKPILASYGLIQFPYIVAVGLALVSGFPLRSNPETQAQVIWLYLGVMAAMWVLGAVDDIWGTREVGGFKGHFKKLLFERKLTTGALKALGGGAVALAAGWLIHPHDLLQAALAAMVIALATNTLNLLDLRPGRAVAVFFLGLGVTYILTCFRLVASPFIAAIP